MCAFTTPVDESDAELAGPISLDLIDEPPPSAGSTGRSRCCRFWARLTSGSGEPYFSMKLIEGRSLSRPLDDPEWKPDVRDRARLLADCRGRRTTPTIPAPPGDPAPAARRLTELA